MASLGHNGFYTQISRKLVFPQLTSVLPDHFEIHNMHYNNDNAMVCAESWNVLTIAIDDKDESDLVRFQYKMSFRWISNIATIPRILHLWDNEAE